MKYGLLSCLSIFFLLYAYAQTPWENPLKKMLKEGKPVVGLTVTVPSAEIAVQAANLADAEGIIGTVNPDLYKENLRRFASGETLLNIVDKQKGY